MPEAVYGGACIGKDGIKSNLAKLEAIAKWPIPSNIHELMKFLGLTDYFQPLIKYDAKSPCHSQTYSVILTSFTHWQTWRNVNTVNSYKTACSSPIGLHAIQKCSHN